MTGSPGKVMLSLVMVLFALCAFSAEKKIVILQTSDIHAHLDNERCSRLLSIIQRENRLAGGEKNTLRVDIGDLLQGDYTGALSRGMIGIHYLNAGHYQAWIPGNHDLEFGFKTLLDCRNAFTGTVLAANLFGNGVTFPAWRMYEVNGVAVALIGLTYPYRQQMFQTQRQEQFTLENYSEALKKRMPEVMAAKPDIIILAAHFGLVNSYDKNPNSLFALAARYPQISLVLGGHTHQVIPGRPLGSDVNYVEPGKHGEGVMRTEIVWNITEKRISAMNSRFLPTGTIAASLPCPAFVAEVNRQAERLGRQTVGKLNFSSKNNENALSELYNRAACASTGADFAYLNAPPLKFGLPETVTEKTLFQMAPYEDELIVLNLTAEELLQVVKEQRESRKKYHARSWLLPKRSDAKLAYQVVFSGFTLATALPRQPILHRLSQQPDKAKGTGITIREALRRYLGGADQLSGGRQ